MVSMQNSCGSDKSPAHLALPLSLPAHGLTLLKAKHLGILSYYLFVTIDLPDSLIDTKIWKVYIGYTLESLEHSTPQSKHSQHLVP
jgi:hypothetical protein